MAADLRGCVDGRVVGRGCRTRRRGVGPAGGDAGEIPLVSVLAGAGVLDARPHGGGSDQLVARSRRPPIPGRDCRRLFECAGLELRQARQPGEADGARSAPGRARAIVTRALEGRSRLHEGKSNRGSCSRRRGQPSRGARAAVLPPVRAHAAVVLTDSRALAISRIGIRLDATGIAACVAETAPVAGPGHPLLRRPGRRRTARQQHPGDGQHKR